MPKARDAFLVGLLTGLLCVAPQLAFFYSIFGSPAFTLWTILAAWIAAFVGLLHLDLRNPRLWCPNGYGAPTLHDLDLRVPQTNCCKPWSGSCVPISAAGKVTRRLSGSVLLPVVG